MENIKDYTIINTLSKEKISKNLNLIIDAMQYILENTTISINNDTNLYKIHRVSSKINKVVKEIAEICEIQSEDEL